MPFYFHSREVSIGDSFAPENGGQRYPPQRLIGNTKDPSEDQVPDEARYGLRDRQSGPLKARPHHEGHQGQGTQKPSDESIDETPQDAGNQSYGNAEKENREARSDPHANHQVHHQAQKG